MLLISKARSNNTHHKGRERISPLKPPSPSFQPHSVGFLFVAPSSSSVISYPWLSLTATCKYLCGLTWVGCTTPSRVCACVCVFCAQRIDTRYSQLAHQAHPPWLTVALHGSPFPGLGMVPNPSTYLAAGAVPLSITL